MDRQLADRYTDGEAGRYQIQLAHRIVRGVVGRSCSSHWPAPCLASAAIIATELATVLSILKLAISQSGR